ncbi:hypothetical protein SDC9_141517 [bioreactor metagenome]|uniref:Uncharacterized protein n=1 Tax=bioreactor metagenome TaxID=1076179 RepID=A0A645DYH8_9ZZZZ
MVAQPGGDIGSVTALCAALFDALLDGWGVDDIARLVGTGGSGFFNDLIHQNFHHGLRPDAAAPLWASRSASLRSARSMPDCDMRRSSSSSSLSR